MSIVLVGGHDRMHDEYKGICSKRGHRVKVYTQMPARFDKAIGNPDGIVLFTGTVSHKMILTAMKEAKKKYTGTEVPQQQREFTGRAAAAA